MSRKQRAMHNNFHQGSRAEYLAQFALSRVGLVVPVPRQADHFLIDLFVHLGKQVGRQFVPTGPTVAVQAKSSRKPIVLKDRKLEIFLNEIANPYFIAVVDINEGTIEVFSTQERLNHARFPRTKLTLRFAPEPRDFKNDPIATEAEMYLREPISTYPIAALDRPSSAPGTASRFHDVLNAWARLESLNLAWHAQGFPLFARPAPTESNECPDLRSVKFIKIVNRDTLESAVNHLGVVIGALRQIASEQRWAPLERACADVLDEIDRRPWQNAGDSTTS